ncbi:hypothetical protein [Terrabacter sp. MAHUQ-38]|uniref:hypothetical protein n=1 Tax=unclassified Terrabacter TaxID=2630222 RepID=UPI00165DE204|nr:hypothetical protein [Terrabacter sp. MAHUQ-38]MBC9823040.1 hypothetical protein [Terrabacter sp. MAHUQ-38]
MSRRDRLVVGGCALILAVQAVPLIILWAVEGPETAGDAALVAVSSPALVGVTGFAVALAAGLATPRLEPLEPSPGPVVERGVGAPGTGGGSGPHRPTSQLRTGLRRVRWAAIAALSHVASLALAYVLDNGARAGSHAFGESLDDGSAMWGFAVLVIHGLVLDLRGLVAFGVAFVVLALARRPVRAAAPGRPVSRTTP